MQVANPYLNMINQRFGFDPTGLAQGYDIPASPTWYQPPMVLPKVLLPSLSGAAGGVGTAPATTPNPLLLPGSTGGKAPKVTRADLLGGSQKGPFEYIWSGN
jgi:hypothetical protein